MRSRADYLFAATLPLPAFFIPLASIDYVAAQRQDNGGAAGVANDSSNDCYVRVRPRRARAREGGGWGGDITSRRNIVASLRNAATNRNNSAVLPFYCRFLQHCVMMLLAALSCNIAQ